MYSNDSQYFGELVSVFVHMYKPVIALALHGYTVHERPPCLGVRGPCALC